MAAIRVRVAENGRMSLPASVRRQLGLEGGGELLLQVEDGEVRMATRAERVRRVQARMRELARGKPVSVEDFLAWKREQAALEGAEAVPSATGRTA
jgi:AbrB family looped-hinge helix DNA binding protein